MRKGLFATTLIYALIVSTGFAGAQSNAKETRNVAGFSNISFGVSGNLYINIGPEFKVVLEGDRSLLDNILTEVTGNRLVIKKDNWRRNLNGNVTVYITMPEIDGLGVSGSGRAEILDAVKSSDLGLSVSGSGKLYTADIVTERLDCDISGSGDVILGGSGRVNRGELAISGSGSYTGENTKIAIMDVSISGSGNCSCNVTESLNASISGSGNVTYLGNPRIDARSSGSGRVRSR